MLAGRSGGLRLASVFVVILAALLAGQAESSRINFYSDQKCNSFSHERSGPDGTMSGGSCALLEKDGEFGSFKVVEMDNRCAVTIYKPVQDPTVTCNPQTALWAQVGDCFAASAWTWYTISDCVVPSDLSGNSSSSASSASESSSSSAATSAQSTSASSPTAPSTRILSDTSASPSSTPTTTPGGAAAESTETEAAAPPTSSPAAESNTAAIAGGVAGGVVGLGLIVGLLWYCLFRKRKARRGVQPLGPAELSSEHRAEMSAGVDTEKSAAVELSQYRHSTQRPELAQYRNSARPEELFSPAADDSYTVMTGATYSPVTDSATLYSPYMAQAHMAEMPAEKEGSRAMGGTFHPAHRWDEKPPL